jgi:hypothetical protein
VNADVARDLRCDSRDPRNLGVHLGATRLELIDPGHAAARDIPLRLARWIRRAEVKAAA